jgi:hypothetical protein
MNPPHDAADAVEIQPRRRRAGQHTGALGRIDEGSHGLRRQSYVGVQVDPRERTADLVAEPDRVGLARHVGLDDPHRELSRNVGRPVGARIGDDDDVELTAAGRREQISEIGRDHGFLVVGRHHDTGHWSIGLDDGCVRAHDDLRTETMHTTTGVPIDRISVHGGNRAIERQESLRR